MDITISEQEEYEQNICTVSISCRLVLTILGLAGAVVWLRQVALHAGAGVGAFSVGTGLTACPVYSALIKI